MRNHLRQALSTSLAIAILGYAVMLSASLAKAPYGSDTRENAFDGPPVGHPEKALVDHVPCSNERDRANEQPTAAQAAFDWGLEACQPCPACRKAEPAVVQVVLDVPELLGPSDSSAIELIKRKLGMNAFQGSIFDGPEIPAAQLLKQEAPVELHEFDRVLDSLQCDYELPALSCDRAGACTAALRAADSSSAQCEEKCAGKPETCSTESACASAAAFDDAGDDHDEYAASRRNVGRAVPWQAHSQANPESSDPIEVLRECSPGLDELANRLEDLELYAEADAIREAAQQLRVKARILKQGNMGTARFEAPRWSSQPVAYDYNAVPLRGFYNVPHRGYDVPPMPVEPVMPVSEH